VTIVECDWSKASAIILRRRRGLPGNRTRHRAFVLKRRDFILIVVREVRMEPAGCQSGSPRADQYAMPLRTAAHEPD